MAGTCYGFKISCSGVTQNTSHTPLTKQIAWRTSLTSLGKGSILLPQGDIENHMAISEDI